MGTKNAMVFILITVMINSIGFGIMTVMLLSLLGLGIDFFIMGLAPTIAFLFIGRVIAGTFGATFSTANAYIADISPPETRAQNFGLIGASFGVGFMLGPVIGGLIGNEFGPRAPFIAAGVLALLNVTYGFFFLPETLPEDKRRPFDWTRSNPFGSLKSLGRIKGVKPLIFIMFLLYLAHTVYPTTFTFSVQEGLNWTAGDVGIALGAFGVASMIVQGGLIRIIIPKIGMFWAAILGVTSAAIAYLMMGAADKGWIIYAAGPFAAFAGLYGPAITNMMSTRISETEQGELQGAIGAAQGLTMMIGPFAMSGMFWYFGDAGQRSLYGLEGFPMGFIRIAQHIFGGGPIPYIPGAPFLLAGTLSALCLGLLILATNKADRDARSKPKDKAKPQDKAKVAPEAQSAQSLAESETALPE